jgi:threonine/homoserine/homoserine lactone efflux protein
MIDTSALPVFLAAVAALLIVPGPDFLLISSQAVSHGARHGLACSLGIFLAGVAQTLLVALGLGQIMEAWPVVATAIRFLGAAYLAYLGIKLLLAWRNHHDVQHLTSQPIVAQSPRTLLVVGLASNLLNPKALLFFSVFIPQFVNPGLESPTTQILVWGGILSVLALGYNVLLSILFASVRTLRIDAPNIQRHSQGVLGLLFLALAARLSWTRAA